MSCTRILYSRKKQNKLEKGRLMSLHLSRTLDGMGYSLPLIEFRRGVYIEDCKLMKKMYGRGDYFTVGSKGEGITAPYQSDIDMLAEMSSVLCVEKGNEVYDQAIDKDVTIFTMVTGPGYSILELSRPGVPIDKSVACSCLKSEDGKYYFSSDTFSKYVMAQARQDDENEHHFETLATQGPSAPASFKNKMDFDRVIALPCLCTSILSKWFSRPRKYEWPSLEVRKEIVKLKAYLVTTGHTDSVNKKFEWRICFNTGELKLMNSLNEIQRKLYIVLKMILKEIILPIEKEVTSYVMKNTVFWLAEMYPMEIFTEENLLNLIIKALRFLKRCIKMSYVPYYMIPDRNLLAGKITPPLQKRLYNRVSHLLKIGPAFLLACRKMALLGLNTKQLHEFQNWRDEVEVLYLMQGILESRKLTKEDTENGQEEQTQANPHAIAFRILNLLQPNWRELAIRGVDISFIMDEILPAVLG